MITRRDFVKTASATLAAASPLSAELLIQRTVRPVLGGSGIYDGASGQVISTNLGADGWTHVFRITVDCAE